MKSKMIETLRLPSLLHSVFLSATPPAYCNVPFSISTPYLSHLGYKSVFFVREADAVPRGGPFWGTLTGANMAPASLPLRCAGPPLGAAGAAR